MLIKTDRTVLAQIEWFILRGICLLRSEFLKDFPSLKVENRDSAVWVSLNSSSDSEIEQQILRIFTAHNTRDMYLTTLKRELEAVNPNLEATIRRSGVTRFSVYLNRMIPSVEVNGRYVMLKK